MNADVTPMNADTPSEGIGRVAHLIAGENSHEEPSPGLIGVHRRDIGVHRRFPRISIG
ncbi:MAG: hypothetical protein IPL06_08425 [Betaproteobacteria bacterium]|nr:hypothetical protein [Betaproteobacteria bacterium]